MIEPQTWQRAFSDLAARVLAYLPTALLALVILVAGWALARLLAALVRRLALRVGLDDVVEGSGLAEGLAQAKITRPASDLVALLVFWLVFLTSLLLALETLGWTIAIAPLQNLLAYLPRLLAAILILVVGAWLAQALGRLAQAAVASMGVEFHEGIGRVVRGLLLLVTAVLAVEQLGLNLTFLTHALTNLLTIIAAGLALAFGLGGRDVTRNVLAGYYARDQFTPGDELVVEGKTGILEAIGTVNAQIGIGGEILIVPNTRLTEGTVRVRKNSPYGREDTNPRPSPAEQDPNQGSAPLV